MSRFKEIDSHTSQGSNHRDYELNLKAANTFIDKTKKSWLPGMNVQICDGHHIPKALIIISYMPPKKAKMGNYATPISLHDEFSRVNKKIECIFNCYFKFVTTYLEQQQLRLF